jgi:calcineurin-like phosphoesterase family protein
MAARAFLTADTHWSHEGVCRFTKPDGTPLRPWKYASDMDTAMTDLWNETVNPEDKVYILGDWCINRKAISIAAKLNGRKILIKGNHDIFRLEDYSPYFSDIRAYHVLPAHRVIMSHIPVHESQLDRWRANIHGHLHSGVVMRDPFNNGVDFRPDRRYTCVSVEHTDFKPVLLDKVLNDIDERLKNS